MNSAIELHDSRIGRIRVVDGEALIEFAPAYLHKSEGRPGMDPGTGWVQAVRLTLSRALIRGPLPDLPDEISDGGLRVDSTSLENVIPIPLQARGDIELRLLFVSGHEVIFTADSIALELTGEANYVEEFP